LPEKIQVVANEKENFAGVKKETFLQSNKKRKKREPFQKKFHLA